MINMNGIKLKIVLKQIFPLGTVVLLATSMRERISRMRSDHFAVYSRAVTDGRAE
jgi:hypothetical protein